MCVSVYRQTEPKSTKPEHGGFQGFTKTAPGSIAVISRTSHARFREMGSNCTFNPEINMCHLSFKAPDVPSYSRGVESPASRHNSHRNFYSSMMHPASRLFLSSRKNTSNNTYPRSMVEYLHEAVVITLLLQGSSFQQTRMTTSD